jgi:polyferredoxin
MQILLNFFKKINRMLTLKKNNSKASLKRYFHLYSIIFYNIQMFLGYDYYFNTLKY